MGNKPIRVVVVDDSFESAPMLGRLLDKNLPQQLEIKHIISFEQAKVFIETKAISDPPDIFIVDLHLQNKIVESGAEIISLIQRLDSGSVIVLRTSSQMGEIENEDLLESLRVGDVLYWDKSKDFFTDPYKEILQALAQRDVERSGYNSETSFK